MEHLPRVLEHPTARRQGSATPWEARPAQLPTVPRGADPDPGDLAGTPTRQLRMLCNRTYQLLDLDRPSPETRGRYDALVEELGRREGRAERVGADDVRETFRDNALSSRFELYRNGAMAGYVQYEMRGGAILLRNAVIDPKFRRLGLDPVLMQAVLLNAHRRRLAVVPACPQAQAFLAAHPQFLPLIPAEQRRRFELLLASRAAAGGQERR